MRIGIIGGSGVASTLLDRLGVTEVEAIETETPFGTPSDAITTGRCAGVDVAVLARHGAGHLLNPTAVPYRANVFALKSLGCTHVLAFGATGSLRDTFAPGDLVVCDQLIDKTDGRPRTFYEHAAVHVEFAEPFCPVMREWLIAAARSLKGLTVHERGTYVCMEGPSFSTRAESNMHRQWGADVVGMTACPEARLVREAEMSYALIALPTDYDCWKPRLPGGDEQSLLAEIVGNLRRATEASFDLLTAALGDCTTLRDKKSPAHQALAASIWSTKELIDEGEIERLRPLWGRWFS